MKNLKIIGIVFIVLCCLAPICATNLNQSNIGNDTQTADINASGNMTNNSLKYIPDPDYPLSVHVDDVKKGDPIIIDVECSNKDVYISEGIFVYFEGGIHFLWLEHNHGQLVLDSSNYGVGPHKVVVTKQTYSDIYFVPDETTFNIYE